MTPNHAGWLLLVVLVGCGILVSLLQWAYFAWRFRAFGRTSKMRGSANLGAAAGEPVGRLLRAIVQLDATLRETRSARPPGAPQVAAESRYEMGRKLATGGATAEKIAVECGMSRCEAELVRAVHAAPAAGESNGSPPAAPASVPAKGAATAAALPGARAVVPANRRKRGRRRAPKPASRQQ